MIACIRTVCLCELIALIYTLTRNDIRVQHYQHQYYLFTSFEYLKCQTH